MSVQFGKWNFDGQPPTKEQFEKAASILAAYGPDSNHTYSNGGVRILYRALQTTKESRRETQPHVSPSSAVLTWDGRLDNRTELLRVLHNSVSLASPDVAIAAAAYERWGTNCFGKLIGDWALSIWNPHNRSLILAKDPVGTRNLYYFYDAHQVTWSTVFDPLVRLAGKTFSLNEEFIAGWLAVFPAPHVTPCEGIHSVPPSSSVLLTPGKRTISKYWDFDPQKRIRYRSDAEYEEHFRTVFFKAVQRHLRSDSPILAELSGGRDSSSIVCVADSIIARGQAETPRLDTISNYDDSEPNWNERPYFTKIEEKRGRTGWHVDVGVREDSERLEEPAVPLNDRFITTPGSDGRCSPQLRACLTSQGNRVVLSGTGGDEVMGGVPTASPEFQDLLARARFGALAHQLKAWALAKRKPWFQLFWGAVRDFFPSALLGVPEYVRPVPWLQPRFVKRNWTALTGYGKRTRLFGAPPSLQANVEAFDVLRRQLANTALSFEPAYEKRYPYLDRDLLEFMYAIPREQLVRPAQRRSLMRRALAGIVPDEILNRKTKAFVARAPMKTVSRDWAKLMEMTQNMVIGSLGIVDSARLIETLQKARRGEDEIPMISLTRTIFIEGWLKDIRKFGVVKLDTPEKRELAWQPSIEG